MRRLLGVAVVAAALTGPTCAWAADDFPPPIDRQSVQDQDAMTWADYKPVPGHNWADNSTLEPTVRNLKIAVVAVDFSDQPFVITQPKDSDPFGNPQVDPIAARGRRQVLRELLRHAQAPSTTATRSTSTGWSRPAAGSA